MDFLDDSMREQTRAPETVRRSFTQTAAFPWLVVLTILIGLFVAFSPLVIIRSGHRGVATFFGDTQGDVYTEGVHLKYPLLRIHQFDVRSQTQDTSTGVVTKDMQLVTLGVTVTYRLDSGKLKDAYTDVGADIAGKVLVPAVKDSLNVAATQFTAEELVSKREDATAAIKIELDELLQSSGVIIQAATITNVDFSKTLKEAFEARVVAQQEAETAKFKAQAAIANNTAAANLDNTEADRIRTVGEALKGYEAYIQYEIMKKWDGTTPLYLAPTPSVQITNTER